MWLSALTLALAASAGALTDAAHVTSADWSLSEEAWWIDAPVALVQQTGDLRLRGGYVFRVDDAEGAVGAVFVADGTWTVTFEDAREARRFANRRVLAEGDDAATLTEVARGGSWVSPVDRGALFGLDVWPTLAPALIEVVTKGGALVAKRPHGIEEILVVEHVSLAAARRAAASLLEQRTRQLREHAYDPASWIAIDRLEGCRLAEPEGVVCNRVAELRTEATWDRFAGATFVGAGGRWLGWVRDPRGLLDPRAAEQVAALAVDPQGAPRGRVVATAAFPLDPFGVPASRQRVDLVEAAVAHAVSVEEGVLLKQETVADLTVRAVGQDVRVVAVDVPHVEQQPYMKKHPLRNGWELLGVEQIDGTPLRHTHVSLTRSQRDGRGAARTLLVELPEVLAAGGTATLRVRYRDHHRYAHYYETEDGLIYKIESTGIGAAFRALPTVRGHGGYPVPAVVRAGLPREQDKHQIAISGNGRRVWEDHGRVWTEVRTTHGEIAGVAVGRWSVRHEPAGPRSPAVTAALQVGHADGAEKIPTLVRQAVAFNESLLHPVGLQHVTVAELGSTDSGEVRVGWGQELVMWSPSFAESRGLPLLLKSAMVTVMGVHQQWWLDSGAHGVDASLPAQMSAAYALMFLTRTTRKRDLEELQEMAQRIVTAGRFSAISEGGSIPVGAWVLGRSLRADLGDEAFFQGVHHVVLGNAPPTWDGLQFAFEQTSGRGLDDWFDVWVHGDHAPSVALDWSQEGDQVHAALTTDIPFGGFRVPVRVDGVLHHVDLVDGEGALTVPVSGRIRRARIAIDPDQTLLLAGKRVSRRSGGPAPEG